MKLLLRLGLVALVTAFVFLVAGLLATWAPDRSVESLSARWAAPPSRFITVQGMQVHVRDEGPRDDRLPIVLLHGTSASLHTWDGWVRQLSTQRRVIRFDLPAFGLTGPRPDADYTIAAYVGFVSALLDALQVPECILAGNSLGGQIAWNTALAHPQRVRKLVLVDAAGYPLQPESVPIGFQLARIPVVRDAMRHVLPRGLVQSSVRNVYGDPAKVTPELVDRYYELTLRAGNRQALVQRLQQPLSGNEAAIPSIRQPTLILWGAQDRLIPRDHAQRFAHDLPTARVHVFDGLGHVPHEEDPQATVAVLQGFLEQREASRTP